MAELTLACADGPLAGRIFTIPENLHVLYVPVLRQRFVLDDTLTLGDVLQYRRATRHCEGMSWECLKYVSQEPAW